MTVSGRALAVAGGIQHLVLVVGCWVYTVWRFVARIGGMEVKSSALPGAGRGTGWGGASKWKSSEEREGRRRGGVLFLSCRPPSLSVSLPHSAVASQLVPRGTWRHLVSVSTGAGTAEGCGRFSSAPVAGEEAADARLQGVAGAVTPEREQSEEVVTDCLL